MSGQLAAKLFPAFDLLRDDFDRSTAFDVVSTFLILKFASDRPTLIQVDADARWDAIVRADDPVESVNRALHALKRDNPDSIGSSNSVLHLPYGFRSQTAKRLIELFSGLDFRPDAVKFRQEAGQVYDQVHHWFWDKQGKRGAEFAALPTFLSKLMTRLADPSPRQSVYDPFAGYGDLLATAWAYVQDRHGADAAVDVVGQTRHPVLWDRARVNLVLHDMSDFELHNSDALYDPLSDGTGAWNRFDRVVTAPPFGVKYHPDRISAPERMHYGWTSERGHSADLMIMQHVLASLSPEGIGVALAPQGVLFRGGREGKIRQGIIEDDRIEAVIGLGSNVLPAAPIPVAIIIVRGAREQALPDMSEILFIDAERELNAARSSPHLEAEVIEKIVTSVRQRVAIPGFSRGVLLEEIKANQFDLNIPAYIRRASAPSPDVQTILFGGIAKSEVDLRSPLFKAFGVKVSDMFEEVEGGRLAFRPEDSDVTTEKIESIAFQTESRFAQRCREAWESVSADFQDRLLSGEAGDPFLTLMDDLADVFHDVASSDTVLDTYELRGVWAAWTAANESDLRYFREHGYHASFTLRKLDLDVTIDQNGPYDRAEELTLAAFGKDLCTRATRRATVKRRALSSLFRSWASRYGTSLKYLEAERTLRVAALDAKLRSLGHRMPPQGDIGQ